MFKFLKKQKRHIREMVFFSCTLFLLEILFACVTIFRTDITEIVYAIQITALGLSLIVQVLNFGSVISEYVKYERTITHREGECYHNLSDATGRLYFLTLGLSFVCNLIVTILSII